MQLKNALMSKTTQKFMNWCGGAIRLNKATPYVVNKVIIGRKGKLK